MPNVTRTTYIICRYFVALMILFYGFAKINGTQFTVLQSVLDQPLRDISGFWLTWYYYSYSRVYGNLIGLVQIAGGVFLLFRRTTLFGSCLLLGVMANIVMINIFYKIAPGALIMSLLITACLLFIVWQHRGELVQLFWSAQNTLFPSGREVIIRRAVRWAARGLIVLYPAVFTYRVANHDDHPTSVDGAWRVEDVQGVADSAPFPERIYFEHNRAYMSVFAYTDFSETHHFEVNEDAGQLDIWEGWLDKGDEVFSGEFNLTQDKLELYGTFEAASEPVRVELVRLDNEP